MWRQQYEIRIRGTLNPSLTDALAPVQSFTEAHGTVTVLVKLIEDQSELTGILVSLDSLGLVILELRPAQ